MVVGVPMHSVFTVFLLLMGAEGIVGDESALAGRELLVDDGGLFAIDHEAIVLFGGVLRAMVGPLREAIGPMNGIEHLPMAIVINVAGMLSVLDVAAAMLWMAFDVLIDALVLLGDGEVAAARLVLVDDGGVVAMLHSAMVSSGGGPRVVLVLPDDMSIRISIGSLNGMVHLAVAIVLNVLGLLVFLLLSSAMLWMALDVLTDAIVVLGNC